MCTSAITVDLVSSELGCPLGCLVCSWSFSIPLSYSFFTHLPRFPDGYFWCTLSQTTHYLPFSPHPVTFQSGGFYIYTYHSEQGMLHQHYIANDVAGQGMHPSYRKQSSICSCHSLLHHTVTHPASYSMNMVLFQGVTWSSAKIKNEYSYISTSPGTDSNNFTPTFTFYDLDRSRYLRCHKIMLQYTGVTSRLCDK
jgi:hypothetical protein